MRFDAAVFLEASGEEFRRVRIERGLSRETLAERAGVHPNTIGVAERGDRDLAAITQTRFLLALGCERLALSTEGVIAVLGDERAGLEHFRTLRDPAFARLIGVAIRTRRLSFGLSLDEVALEAGLHRNTLWNIERGLVLAGGLNLYRIYLSLGVRALVPSGEGLSLE